MTHERKACVIGWVVGCRLWAAGAGVGVPEAWVAHEARNSDFFQTQG
jgi:hypothetical protein